MGTYLNVDVCLFKSKIHTHKRVDRGRDQTLPHEEKPERTKKKMRIMKDKEKMWDESG
jgi:hypothetical protein